MVDQTVATFKTFDHQDIRREQSLLLNWFAAPTTMLNRERELSDSIASIDQQRDKDGKLPANAWRSGLYDQLKLLRDEKNPLTAALSVWRMERFGIAKKLTDVVGTELRRPFEQLFTSENPPDLSSRFQWSFVLSRVASPLAHELYSAFLKQPDGSYRRSALNYFLSLPSQTAWSYLTDLLLDLRIGYSDKNRVVEHLMSVEAPELLEVVRQLSWALEKSSRESSDKPSDPQRDHLLAATLRFRHKHYDNLVSVEIADFLCAGNIDTLLRTTMLPLLDGNIDHCTKKSILLESPAPSSKDGYLLKSRLAEKISGNGGEAELTPILTSAVRQMNPAEWDYYGQTFGQTSNRLDYEISPHTSLAVALAESLAKIPETLRDYRSSHSHDKDVSNDESLNQVDRVARDAGHLLNESLTQFILGVAEIGRLDVPAETFRARLDKARRETHQWAEAIAIGNDRQHPRSVAYLPETFIFDLQNLALTYNPRMLVYRRMLNAALTYLASKKQLDGYSERDNSETEQIGEALLSFLNPDRPKSEGAVSKKPFEELILDALEVFSGPLICDLQSGTPALFDTAKRSKNLRDFHQTLSARGVPFHDRMILGVEAVTASEESCYGAVAEELIVEALLTMQVVPPSGRPGRTAYASTPTREEAIDFIRNLVLVEDPQIGLTGRYAPKTPGFSQQLFDNFHNGLLDLPTIRAAVAKANGIEGTGELLLAMGRGYVLSIVRTLQALVDSGALGALPDNMAVDLGLPDQFLQNSGSQKKDAEKFYSLAGNSQSIPRNYAAAELALLTDSVSRAKNNLAKKGERFWRQNFVRLLLEYQEVFKLLPALFPAKDPAIALYTTRSQVYELRQKIKNRDTGLPQLGAAQAWEHLESIDLFGGDDTETVFGTTAFYYYDAAKKGADWKSVWQQAETELLSDQPSAAIGNACQQELHAAVEARETTLKAFAVQPSRLWIVARAIMEGDVSAVCQEAVLDYFAALYPNFVSTVPLLGTTLHDVFNRHLSKTLEDLHDGLMSFLEIDQVDDLLMAVGNNELVFSSQLRHRLEWQALQGRYGELLNDYKKQGELNDQSALEWKIIGATAAVATGLIAGPVIFGSWMIGTSIAGGGTAIALCQNNVCEALNNKQEARLQNRIVLDGSLPWVRHGAGGKDSPFMISDDQRQQIEQISSDIFWSSVASVALGFAGPYTAVGAYKGIVQGGKAVYGAIRTAGWLQAGRSALVALAQPTWTKLAVITTIGFTYDSWDSIQKLQHWQEEHRQQLEQSTNPNFVRREKRFSEMALAEAKIGLTMEEQMQMDQQMQRRRLQNGQAKQEALEKTLREALEALQKLQDGR
jgi:hypothetical protein